MEHIRTIINNWALNKEWEPVNYEYSPPRYDPYELKPSKSFLKERLKYLNKQCYEIIEQKHQLKKENEATQAFVFPTLEERHARIIKRIREYKYRINARPNNSGTIGPAEIARARAVPITQFYTDKIRRANKRLLGRCPFHREKTASFVIYEDQNTFHCFGCQENGDVISYVMKLNKLNFIEAVKYLTTKT